MHKGDTPYKCDQCEKSFTQRGNLVKHQRQHKYKNLRARKIHKCKICTKCFTEKYNLKVSIIAKTLPPLSSLLSPLSLFFSISHHRSSPLLSPLLSLLSSPLTLLLLLSPLTLLLPPFTSHPPSLPLPCPGSTRSSVTSQKRSRSPLSSRQNSPRLYGSIPKLSPKTPSSRSWHSRITGDLFSPTSPPPPLWWRR